ncbi:hypothetical protein [Sinomonas atrocyanea]
MDQGKACQVWEVGCWAGEGAKNVAVAAATGGLDQLRDSVLEAWGKSIAWLGTFWVNVDTTPVITPGTVDQQSDVVWWAQNQLWWYTLVLVVFGILVGAGRLVWEQRSKHLMDIVKQLTTFTLVTGSGVAVLQLLITGFDELAKALLDNATKGTGFAENVGRMISLTGGLGVLLAILFGVLAVLVSLVQLVMMVFRSGILILLAGGLPSAAAFTNTETGKQWFQRFLSWLIAFTLYKPAAALCYAVAFKLTGSDIFASADGGVKVIVGLSLMVLALVALPALMRLVTPMVAAAAGGGGCGRDRRSGRLSGHRRDQQRPAGWRPQRLHTQQQPQQHHRQQQQQCQQQDGPSGVRGEHELLPAQGRLRCALWGERGSGGQHGCRGSGSGSRWGCCRRGPGRDRGRRRRAGREEGRSRRAGRRRVSNGRRPVRKRGEVGI